MIMDECSEKFTKVRLEPKPVVEAKPILEVKADKSAVADSPAVKEKSVLEAVKAEASVVKKSPIPAAKSVLEAVKAEASVVKKAPIPAAKSVLEAVKAEASLVNKSPFPAAKSVLEAVKAEASVVKKSPIPAAKSVLEAAKAEAGVVKESLIPAAITKKRLKKRQGPENPIKKKLKKEPVKEEIVEKDDGDDTKENIAKEGVEPKEGTSKDEEDGKKKDDFTKPKRGKIRRSTLRQSKLLPRSKFPRKRTHCGGKKRRKELGVIVPPTIFLLGGNIKDPLNLNSFQDEEINRAMNAVTPKSSPLPTPKHRLGEIEVIIPPNINDPLGLMEEGSDDEVLKKKARKRRKRKRGNSSSGSGKEESFEAKVPIEEPNANIEGAFVPPDSAAATVAAKREALVLNVKDKEAQKKRKMDDMDKIVSPVVPQPGAWKRGQPRPNMPPKKRRFAQTPKFNPRNQRYQYGNYDRYYGYRNPLHELDPRLHIFMQHPELFVDRDVLDIGCNIGHVSLSVARDLGAKTVSGLDIDKHLIGIARKNVKHYVQESQTPAWSNCPSTRMATPRTPYYMAHDSPIQPQPIYYHITQKSPYHPPLQTSPEEMTHKSPAQNSPSSQTSPDGNQKPENEFNPPIETFDTPVGGQPSSPEPSESSSRQPSPNPPVPMEEQPSSPNPPVCGEDADNPEHPTRSPYRPSIVRSPFHPSPVASPRNPSNSGSPHQRIESPLQSPLNPLSNPVSPCQSSIIQSPYHPMMLKSPFNRALLPSPSLLQSPFHASPSRKLEPLIPPNNPANVSLFPVCMPILYGPLHVPGFNSLDDDSSTPKTFPHNVNFVQGSYVLESDALLALETPQFDTILCLSITKWLHLNWGDAGLKRAFRRMYAQLRPGGKLILEPQAWPSYHRKKNLTEQIYRNYLSIELTPDKFISYLLSPQVGFTSVEEIGAPQHRSKGFRRPIHVLTKPGQTPSSCNTPVCYTPYSQRTCVRKPVYTSLGAEAFENEEDKK